MRYAQILDNKVHWIFESQNSLEYLYANVYNKDTIVLADITDKPDVIEGWLFLNGEFISPDLPPDLDEQKIIHDFKLIRNKLEKSPVSYKEYLFDYDDDSRDRINEAIGFMERNNVSGMRWVLADNTSIEVTVDDLYAVKDSAVIRSGNLHEYYNILKNQVNAATTPEQLSAIKWDF